MLGNDVSVLPTVAVEGDEATEQAIKRLREDLYQRMRTARPRNPRHFEIFEGGRNRTRFRSMRRLQ